jgi:hypothetical protein
MGEWKRPIVMLRGHLLTAPASGISPEGLANASWTFSVPLRFLDSVAGLARADNDTGLRALPAPPSQEEG